MEFRSLGAISMHGSEVKFGRSSSNFALHFHRSREQTKIASFLDRETAKIDGLVGEQRRLIELLKEKRQAVISHAVTKGLNPHAPLKPSGIEWLGDVPEHWEVSRLTRLLAASLSALRRQRRTRMPTRNSILSINQCFARQRLIGEILQLIDIRWRSESLLRIAAGDLVDSQNWQMWCNSQLARRVRRVPVHSRSLHHEC